MTAKRTEAEEAAWLEAKAECRRAAEDFEREWISERLAAQRLAAAQPLVETSGTAPSSYTENTNQRQEIEAPAPERDEIMTSPLASSREQNDHGEGEEGHEIGSGDRSRLSVSAIMVLNQFQRMRQEGRPLNGYTIRKECDFGQRQWSSATKELRSKGLIDHDGFHWFRSGSG